MAACGLRANAISPSLTKHTSSVSSGVVHATAMAYSSESEDETYLQGMIAALLDEEEDEEDDKVSVTKSV